MDDVVAPVVLTFIVVLALLGVFHVVQSSVSTSLLDRDWECTEVTIISGKPECIKYERKGKK